ncbi:MAG: hypothetical protein AAFY03_04660, partial [Pseudomonadota bacterium]
ATDNVGGSLVEKGGHTPFEPALAGSAILHGPSLHNQAESYAALMRAGGSICVDDGPSLGIALTELDDAMREDLCQAAIRALGQGDPGALARLAARIAEMAKTHPTEEPRNVHTTGA